MTATATTPTPTAPVTPGPASGVLRNLWAGSRRYRPITAMLLILLVIFGIMQPAFLTSDNLQNILTSVSIVWIIAMGMTFVLISAGLDLSVGAVAALCGFLVATLLEAGVPGIAAIVLTVLAGGAIGALVNGFLIGPAKLSVFVVTLASLTTLTGIVSLWSDSQSVYVTAPIIGQMSTASYFGLRAPIWIMIATFLVALYVQSRTYFGRDVYAVGGSIQAARLSGIRSSRTIMGVYGLVGVCGALAGIIAVGRSGAATPQVDQSLALQAIAAVLLGGTFLTGGAGGVGGTAIGVLFLGALQNGLSLSGVSAFWQQVATGLILLAAVLLDRFERSSMSHYLPRRWPTGNRPTRNHQETP